MARYPVYVISKGRHDACLTAKFLIEDKCPFHLVVEPQEADLYRQKFGDLVLVLPFSNLGRGSIPARNWCWEHSMADGHARHWILDDNIYNIRHRLRGKRIRCSADLAFTAVEDFIERYENIGIAGLAYTMFTPDDVKVPPFYLNNHVYSCLLIDNALPIRWRGRYNEDTDLCLQVLSLGLCTVLVNYFMIQKVQSMVMKGGNTADLYQGDGRLRMARSLERMWPHVVETKRRFKRPQHVIKNAWGNFTTPLKLRPDAAPIDPSRYAMELKPVREVKSKSTMEWLRQQNGNAQS